MANAPLENCQEQSADASTVSDQIFCFSVRLFLHIFYKPVYTKDYTCDIHGVSVPRWIGGNSCFAVTQNKYSYIRFRCSMLYYSV